jgi:hypothetical protein
LKLYKRNNAVLNAESKFAPDHGEGQDLTTEKRIPKDLDQLGELAIELLNDKNLEVSKVRPFFWSLVEAYVDRFQLYPFDVSKVLFSHLELNDYPKDQMQKLVEQLESQYEKAHGRPMRKSTELADRKDTMDDELKPLRDSLKYAAMVDEVE